MCSLSKSLLEKRNLSNAIITVTKTSFRKLTTDTTGPSATSYDGNKIPHDSYGFISFIAWSISSICLLCTNCCKNVDWQFNFYTLMSYYILSDIGTDYKNTILEALIKLLIERIYTSPHHSQGNGKLKEWHRLVHDSMRKWFKMIMPFGMNWCQRY